MSHNDLDRALVSNHERVKVTSDQLKQRLESYLIEGRAFLGLLSEKGVEGLPGKHPVMLKGQRRVLERLDELDEALQDNQGSLLEAVAKSGISEDDKAFIEGILENRARVQEAQIMELDRILVNMQTSLDEKIDKSKDALERHIELTVVKDQKLAKANLFFSIVNFLGIIGVIVWLVLL